MGNGIEALFAHRSRIEPLFARRSRNGLMFAQCLRIGRILHDLSVLRPSLFSAVPSSFLPDGLVARSNLLGGPVPGPVLLGALLLLMFLRTLSASRVLLSNPSTDLSERAQSQHTWQPFTVRTCRSQKMPGTRTVPDLTALSTMQCSPSSGVVERFQEQKPPCL